MSADSRSSRTFVVVARSEAIVTEARRALAPYRRTKWLRDEREMRAWIENESPPLGIVLEADLGGVTGFDVLRELRERFPFVPAVLLAESPTSEHLERGYKLRASHVSLPLHSDALMPFVFRALTEEVVADERVGFLVESLIRGGVLTLREAELLVLVIGDMPREKIIARMAISENTLKGHVRQLLRKLEAGDLDKLAARVFRVALQNGGRAASIPPPRTSGEHRSVRRETEPSPREEESADPVGRKRVG